MAKETPETIRRKLEEAMAARQRRSMESSDNKESVETFPDEETYKASSETAQPGCKLYSELFGVVPPSGFDFNVPCYSDEDWSESDRAFIPDISKFEGYVINHDILEQELRALRNDLTVLVVGPTGSGKTSLQEYLCAVIRQPYLRINGRQDMESDTLLGKPWVDAGSMTFRLGELPKAMTSGWFVAFDEPWKVPAGIQMSLQRMLERGGILQIDDMPGDLADKQIVPKNTFKMVLCDNVVGTGDGAIRYGATQIQDGSTLNRLDIVLRMDYLSQAQEEKMLASMHEHLTKKQVSSMIKLARLLRVGFEQDELSAAVSPRNLYAWGLMYKELGDMKRAFEATIATRFAEETEHEAVMEHYRVVFG